MAGVDNIKGAKHFFSLRKRRAYICKTYMRAPPKAHSAQLAALP